MITRRLVASLTHRHWLCPLGPSSSRGECWSDSGPNNFRGRDSVTKLNGFRMVARPNNTGLWLHGAMPSMTAAVGRKNDGKAQSSLVSSGTCSNQRPWQVRGPRDRRETERVQVRRPREGFCGSQWECECRGKKPVWGSAMTSRFQTFSHG